MPRLLNSYAAQSDLGATLQNLTTALFSGPGPAALEERKALTESRRAQAELRAAQMRKAELETAGLEQQMAAGRDFLPEFVSSRAGITRPQLDVFQAYRSSGAFPEGADTSWLTPDVRGRIEQALAAGSAYSADPRDRNPNQLGQLLEVLQGLSVGDRALSGGITRPQVEAFGAARGAAGGKPAYGELSGDVTGSISRYFGNTQVPDNAVNRAVIGAKDAAATKDRAAANLSTARAGQVGKAGTGKGKWVVVKNEDSETGFSHEWVAQDETAPALPPKRKALKGEDVVKAINTLLNVSIDRGTGQPVPGSRPPLAGQDLADLISKSQGLYATPGTEIPEGDAMSAVLEAVRQLTGNVEGGATEVVPEVIEKRGFLLPDKKRDVQRLRRASPNKNAGSVNQPAAKDEKKPGAGKVIRYDRQGNRIGG